MAEGKFFHSAVTTAFAERLKQSCVGVLEMGGGEC